ncbi:MAG TPA: DNA polymerase IV [Thermoleophilaceae bacterium]|nr:DNA polymerase IV [Thermoleophilaceae bacterium]
MRDWPHVYAHLDLDAFYVSVELARRPELRGRPVVVAGPSPRAVVTTASYEARRFGIFSATPAARARRLCPEAVFVEPDFAAYRDRSLEVMAILREEIDRVETVGLDEAYLDLSDLERPTTAARRVKATVRERTGLACSVGLGPNKLVAKVASDADKPDGFVVLSAAAARERFGGEPPGLLPGIGPKTAARLASLGIDTLDGLAAASEADLSGWFGPRLGRTLGRLARFEDDRPLELARTAKSESRETTFHTDLRGVPALLPALEQLGRELCERLQAQGRAGRTVGIKVRLDDFSTHTRARTIPEPTNDAALVGSVAGDLLRRLGPPRPVRLLGVRVAGLDVGGLAQAQPRPGGCGQLALSLEELG